MINYLANKFHVSAYKIAFTLGVLSNGVLSKGWFINKGLIKEGDKLNKSKLQHLFARWRTAGKALIDKVKQSNKPEVINLLTKRADPNFQDVNGGTALREASMAGHKDIVKMLEEAIAKQQEK